VKVERLVAVLATPSAAGAAPPGVGGEAYAAALLEDVCDLVATMSGVRVLLAACPRSHADAVADAAWPGTRVIGLDVDRPGRMTIAVVDAVVAAGSAATEIVVLAGDAPDLPPMLIAKLFAALDRADVAVCPAENAGLVALGVRLPIADWVRAAEVSLDTADAVARLAQAAPKRRSLAVGPGWRRMRRPEDAGRLDPGLEGWEATRDLLSGGSAR
jgi:molybdopterin-guanine dinucleotide biosynthesis protein A